MKEVAYSWVIAITKNCFIFKMLLVMFQLVFYINKLCIKV